MSSMLDTLLDINQLEAGIVRREIVDFPIDAAARAICGPVQLITRQRIGLGWRVVPSSLSVRSDPRLLEQMIRNLLVERSEIHQQGQAPARLPAARRQAAHRGLGHRDRHSRRRSFTAIFEEFHQLDNPARERSKGLGLGLAIVQRLADLLGHADRCPLPSGQGLGLCRRGAALDETRRKAASPSRQDETQESAPSERHNPGRRGRSFGARDARAPARRRGSPHDNRRGWEKGAGVGGARGDTPGPRRRRLQSAEGSERPPGRRRAAGARSVTRSQPSSSPATSRPTPCARSPRPAACI